MLKKREEVKRLKALKLKQLKSKLEMIGKEGGLENLDEDGSLILFAMLSPSIFLTDKSITSDSLGTIRPRCGLDPRRSRQTNGRDVRRCGRGRDCGLRCGRRRRLVAKTHMGRRHRRHRPTSWALHLWCLFLQERQEEEEERERARRRCRYRRDGRNL